jgi:hypothetical protein
MTEDEGIDHIVQRHGKAIVSMDVPRIMDDLTPESMAKLQAAAGGGMGIQVNSYEVLGQEKDGDDYLYDVKYVGPESFTVRARWSQVAGGWKVVDADIIARESTP